MESIEGSLKGVYKSFAQATLIKSSQTICKDIEEVRAELMNNHKVVELSDLGTGATTKKSIKTIARSSLMSAKEARLLYEILHKNQYKNVIELGTSLGITACYLSKATDGKVTTFEGDNSIGLYATGIFDRLNLKNISLVQGNIDESLSGFLKHTDPIDFALIDANHTFEATMNYFRLIIQKTHTGSIVAVHDINWSKGMRKAWDQIKTMQEVEGTIENFTTGFVFFDKESTSARLVI